MLTAGLDVPVHAPAARTAMSEQRRQATVAAFPAPSRNGSVRLWDSLAGAADTNAFPARPRSPGLDGPQRDGGTALLRNQRHPASSDDEDEKRCAQLREELRNVKIELSSARRHAKELDESVAAKRVEATERYNEFLRRAAAAAISVASALADLKKGRLPRDVTWPSDVKSAWDASERAWEEYKALESELERVRQIVTRLQQTLEGIIREMEENGCGEPLNCRLH